jgi:hypothetical protein
MVKITQFEGVVRSVPTGTRLLKGKVNISDSPYWCMIWAHQSTLHTKAMLQAVADLRLSRQNIKIVSTARILKHGKERQEGTLSTRISKSHTNVKANPRELGHRTFRKLKHKSIWVFDPFRFNLNLIRRPKWVWKLNKRVVLISIQIRRPRLSPIIK